VTYDKPGDAAEIATWCNGRVAAGGVIEIMDPEYTGEVRYRVPLNAAAPQVILKLDRDSYMPLPLAEFESVYTTKLV
jgi:hypothetical protein